MDNEQLEFDFDAPTEVEALTIPELNALCIEFKTQREAKKELENQIKEIEDGLSGLEGKILAQFEANNMTQHRGEFGLIHITKRTQVAQPESMEDKVHFFDYLKEKGIFMDMVSVNSNRLKSWVSEELDNKAKSGDFSFKIPGLKEPTTHKSIGLRK